jgi:hypothetical protein
MLHACNPYFKRLYITGHITSFYKNEVKRLCNKIAIKKNFRY